ncbi:hypothetical protein [Methylorubrum extorquens]
MIRISLTYIFQLAQQIEPLGSLQDEVDIPMRDIFMPLFMAETALEALLSNSVFATQLRSYFTLGHDLLSQIKKITSKIDSPDEPVASFQLYSVKRTYDQYKIALLAELGVMPSYFVMPKGGFDTNSLLENGWLIFPDSVRSKVPEALFDLGEAGKALAFDMPTACGYHLFRATESVLRKYYITVTGNSTHPKVRNIAVYLNAMRQKRLGDEKVLSALDQLSKLHRNPLIHLDVTLSLDEAIAAIGMARSVVTAMLAAMPDQEKLT